jgi:soluble cytochrome b562
MQRSRRVTLLVLIGFASTAALLLAQEAPSPATRPAASVETDMKSMNDCLKQLKAQVADNTKNESSLALVAKMEAASLEAKGAIPRSMSRFPEADRAKKMEGYRTTMLKLIRSELDLEEQLIAGDNTKAATTLATLGDIEKQGHSEYRPKRQN